MKSPEKALITGNPGDSRNSMELWICVRPWEKLPDWRFGQLMVNLMRDYEAEHGRDIFYLEEDEMIQIIEDSCKHFSGGDKT